MNSNKFEGGLHGNPDSSKNSSTKEEEKLSTHNIQAERITTALGDLAIPIEDFPENKSKSELVFTPKDQDIHHSAATKFIEGMLALRERAEGNEVTPEESLAEEARLKELYFEDIKGMSKL